MWRIRVAGGSTSSGVADGCTWRSKIATPVPSAAITTGLSQASWARSKPSTSA